MFNFKELETYSNNLRVEFNEWVSKIIEKQNNVFDEWCNENLFRHFGYMPKLFAVEVDDWHIKEYRPNDTTIVKELYYKHEFKSRITVQILSLTNPELNVIIENDDGYKGDWKI